MCANKFSQVFPFIGGEKEWNTLSIREYLLQILHLLQELPIRPQEKAAGTAVPVTVNREPQHRRWGRQLPLCLE